MNIFRAGFLGLTLSAVCFAQANSVFELKNRIELSSGLLQTTVKDDRLYVIGHKDIQQWDISGNKLDRKYAHDFSKISRYGFLGVLIAPQKMLKNADGTRGVVFLNKVKESPAAGVWDIPAGKEIAKLQRPGKFVQSIAFSTDGKTIITSHGDYAQTEIVFWDSATLAEKSAITVSDMAWFKASPDATKIYTGSGKAKKWAGVLQGFEDATSIELRDTATGKAEKTFRSGGSVSDGGAIKFYSSKGGEPMLSIDGKYLVARKEKTSVVWDTAGDGTPLYELKPADPKNGVVFADLSDDGKYLLATEREIYGWGTSGDVYELATGKLYRSVHLNAEHTIKFVPGGGKYLFGRNSGRGSIYDVNKAERLYSLAVSTYSDSETVGATVEYERLAISPDAKYIAVYGDERVDVFELATGDRLQSLADPRYAKYKDNGKLKYNGLNSTRVQWVGENSLLVYGKDENSITFWQPR